jgi:large subunit ribosomal protein L22
MSEVKVYTATHKFARISPRKARLVADMVRGKNVDEALLILKYNIKRGSAFIVKVVESAIANAEVQKVDADTLKVSKIVVDGGPIIKRWSPRAMGRATPINKRTSHICVELS